MYQAAVKHRFSICDQTNVEAKVKIWKRQHPEDKFLFLQYQDLIETHETNVESGEGDHVEQEVKVTFPVSRQHLLFIHQTPWQRRLQEKYGNGICLLEQILYIHTTFYKQNCNFLNISFYHNCCNLNCINCSLDKFIWGNIILMKVIPV